MKLNISVIIPVYNAERFLEKAVESALKLDEVTEILLVEDCSTDNSLQTCEVLAAKNSKIKLLQHHDKGNHGAGASRNLGLQKATQQFIAFLDADDYYLPNRFEAEKILFENPAIEGVFNAIGTDFISEKGKREFHDKFKENTLTTVRKHAEGKNVFFGLIGVDKDFGSFFHLNGLTIRKSSIEKKRLSFNQDLRVHQDSDFIIKLSYHCHLKSGNITEAVAMRGVHDDNRITKIKLYSSEYYKKQFLLAKSLYAWSLKENKLSKDIIKQLKLSYLSFKIANEKGLKKRLNFAVISLFNPEFLKTKYRFNALKKHE